MHALLSLAAAVLTPLLGFGLLLWLAHLEDTLARDVERARRQSVPPPILTIPVRTVDTSRPPVQLPEQRAAPDGAVLPEGAGGALAT